MSDEFETRYEVDHDSISSTGKCASGRFLIRRDESVFSCLSLFPCVKNRLLSPKVDARQK